MNSANIQLHPSHVISYIKTLYAERDYAALRTYARYMKLAFNVRWTADLFYAAGVVFHDAYYFIFGRGLRHVF